jgi:hypothetical protein
MMIPHSNQGSHASIPNAHTFLRLAAIDFSISSLAAFILVLFHSFFFHVPPVHISHYSYVSYVRIYAHVSFYVHVSIDTDSTAWCVCYFFSSCWLLLNSFLCWFRSYRRVSAFFPIYSVRPSVGVWLSEPPW